MTIARSVRLSKKGQFVIPREMRDALGVKEGDELLVVLEEHRVVLTRPEFYAKSTRGSLRGAWGKSRREVAHYLERERRAWR
jgi:AbrB family looped-hinge helix DNA binding protein